MSKLFTLLLLAAIVAATVLIVGNTGKDTIDLASIEVREYQGENLSSVNDFRENSIKGPQEVNADNYRLEVSGLVQNQSQYTYDQVIGDHDMYRKVVTLDCVEGWSVKSYGKACL